MKKQLLCLVFTVALISTSNSQYFSAPEGRITIGRLGKREFNRVSLFDINKNNHKYLNNEPTDNISGENIFFQKKVENENDLQNESMEDFRRIFLRNVILQLQKIKKSAHKN
jgi:hypothetical protein